MKLEGNRMDNQKAVFSEAASHCFPFFFNKQWRDKKSFLGHRKMTELFILVICWHSLQPLCHRRGWRAWEPRFGLSPWTLTPKGWDHGVQVGVDRLPLGETSGSRYQGHRLTRRTIICTCSKLVLMTAGKTCLGSAQHTPPHMCLSGQDSCQLKGSLTS